MPFLIDTHAHLDADIYRRELDIVVKHALDDGIWVITVGSDLESSRRAIEIAERHPQGVFAAVGLHPLRVPGGVKAEDKLVDMDKFHELARHPKVVALGETGLDHHDLPRSTKADPKAALADRTKESQRKVFSAFLELSRELRLPLILHCREAHDEMLEMLETWDKATRGFDARGVVHCFSGDWKQARRYFNLDFLVSFTGLVTHAHYQAETIKKAPPSRIAVESDCPYLTPTPWSIRRNEPGYVKGVAAALAGIRGVTTEQLAKETTQNALKVFSKMLRG
jgi:TatD DNase family protein